MNKILILLLIISCAILLNSCAHIKETEFYEDGQIKKDTQKTGVLFSDGKDFSLIKVN